MSAIIFRSKKERTHQVARHLGGSKQHLSLLEGILQMPFNSIGF